MCAIEVINRPLWVHRVCDHLDIGRSARYRHE